MKRLAMLGAGTKACQRFQVLGGAVTFVARELIPRVEPIEFFEMCVTLDFGEAPAGSYEITVAVTDQVSGRTVERTRTLTRSELEPARR